MSFDIPLSKNLQCLDRVDRQCSPVRIFIPLASSKSALNWRFNYVTLESRFGIREKSGFCQPVSIYFRKDFHAAMQYLPEKACPSRFAGIFKDLFLQDVAISAR